VKTILALLLATGSAHASEKSAVSEDDAMKVRFVPMYLVMTGKVITDNISPITKKTFRETAVQLAPQVYDLYKKSKTDTDFAEQYCQFQNETADESANGRYLHACWIYNIMKNSWDEFEAYAKQVLQKRELSFVDAKKKLDEEWGEPFIRERVENKEADGGTTTAQEKKD